MEEFEEVIVVANEYFGDTFSRRKGGQQAAARLVREPGNPHDENAVAVYVGKTQQGYLSSARAEKVAPWVDAVGGTHGVEIHFRDDQGFVHIPRVWLGQKALSVTVQQAKKYQGILERLGVGSHTATVEPDDEQLNVFVDGEIVGRLYPKREDPSILKRVLSLQTIRFEIQPSHFSDGLYARLQLPAEIAGPPGSTSSQPATSGVPTGKGPLARRHVLSRLAALFRS